jgi:hypothetical protein
VNGLMNGAQPKGSTSNSDAVFQGHFVPGAMMKAHVAPGPFSGIMAADSLGRPWQGDYIFNSGNLILDLLHNFFLENGARTAKVRDGPPEGGPHYNLDAAAEAFVPDYHPEEILEMAQQLDKKATG